MKSRKTKNWLWRLIVILAAGGILAAVGAYFAALSWAQNFLRSDECRDLLARQIGSAMRARCEIEPISWTGWNAWSAGASLQSGSASGWKRLEADGLQASLDWNGVRRGVWRVPAINLDSLRVNMGNASASPASERGRAFDWPDEERAAPDPEAPAWIRRWLPARMEIGEVDVRRFELQPPAVGAGVAVADLHLKARPAADEGAWHVSGDVGRVQVPGIVQPFRLGRTEAHFDTGALVIHDATARWMGESEVTARGRIPLARDEGWNISGHASGLDLQHVISEVWRPKLGGVVEGDYEISARPGAEVLSSGKLIVRGGVVQALPVLERVADFTHLERFRRVVLDEASGDVEIQGARTRVTNLVLQSNGLIRVEGELSIDGRTLNGNLLVGVPPESQRWIPGARNHVFTEANAGKVPGFVWARVRISGTLDSPREDLSGRLLAAMGQAVLLDAPLEVLGAGVDALGKSGGAVVPPGRAVLDGGKDILKEAGEAAGRGIDTLKDLVPLLPK